MGAKNSETSGRWQTARCLAALVVVMTATQVAAFDAQVGWTSVASATGYRLYTRQSAEAYGTGTDVGLPAVGGDGVVRYVDRGLPTSTLMFFAVTAYDAAGRESARSNELSLLVAGVPTPSVFPTPSRTPTSVPPPTASKPATPTRTPTASSTVAASPTPTARATATRSTPPTATVTPSATPTATPLASWKVSIPTNAHAKSAIAVSVPVRIAAGSDIRQLAVDVSFDPDVVAVQDVQLSSTAGAGTLSADFATPGALSVSTTLAQPMSAGGPVLNIWFAAVGACRSSTVLRMTSCVLDAGAVGCAPSDGRIVVRCR